MQWIANHNLRGPLTPRGFLFLFFFIIVFNILFFIFFASLGRFLFLLLLFFFASPDRPTFGTVYLSLDNHTRSKTIQIRAARKMVAGF